MEENTVQPKQGLFDKLQKLFSTDVIVRRKGNHELKIFDFERTQSYGNIKTNSLVDRFSKIHNYGVSHPYNPVMNIQTLRVQLYGDYEVMDADPIICSALDILADEATLKNEMGEVLQIRSSDENIQKILYNLFYDVLNIEFNLWMWIRNMCKYGDFYLKLEIAEEFGIFNVIPLSTYEITREEYHDDNGEKQKMPKTRFLIDPVSLSIAGMGALVNSKTKDGKLEFENYEVAHFRLLSDANYLPYGKSFIEGARKTFKQYVLLKDAMLLHRISRAPEKRIFTVNVGNLPPAEVDAYMQKLQQKIKKTPYIDQNTGEYNLKYNMMNLMEDFYVPVRGNDTTTKIDTLKGLEYNAIEDVNFLRDEMLSALKVPKSFMGFLEDTSGKATLSAQDIRFARTVERIQRIVLSELYKIALIHLYTQGRDGESLTNFELSLTNSSIVYEQEKVALLKEKVQLAKDITDSKLLPSDWIYDNVFQFSEDQYSEYRDLVIEDTKRLFRLNQIENEGNDPLRSGKSYGTPHDLASLYGKGRSGMNTNGSLPSDYDEKAPVGHPMEKASMIDTQNDPLGRDRLGKAESSSTNDLMSNTAIQEYHKLKNILKSLPKKNDKQLIFEEESNLLDESNIKETNI